MKIGLITNMMDDHRAGIGRYTENVVKGLLSIDKKNDYYLIHSNKISYTFPGNYHEIKLPFFDSIPKKLITGTLIFKKICQDNRLDILHDLGQISPCFFPSITKKILTIFDLGPLLYPQFFTRLTQAYTALFPIIVKNTDRIITISESSKNDIVQLLKIPENRIIVTQLGVESKFKPIKDKQYLNGIRRKYRLPEKFILFVGTIEPRKNISTLINAYNRIPKTNEIRLVIAGQIGWKSDKVFQAALKYTHEKDIIYIGHIGDNDLPALYNLAEVFVYPSLYEGFGLPVLEAMACGCPVITSKFNPLRQNLQKCCFLVNPEDELSLARAIETLDTDRAHVRTLIKEGYKIAHEYNWIKCSYKTLSVYNGLYE